MSSEHEDRDKLIRLDQQVGQLIPMLAEKLDRSDEKLDRLTGIVIELAEQNKRLPVMDQDLRAMEKAIAILDNRISINENRTDGLEFLNIAIKDLRDDVLHSKWTIRVVWCGVGAILLGAVGLGWAIIEGAIIP